MIETDSPYMAPEPFRGRRNSSLYVHRMAETIAEIRGERPCFLRHKHQINTKQDFGKSQTAEKVKKNRLIKRNKRFIMVETVGIEPMTS